MKIPMLEVCLDTSVWMKLWLPEEGSDLAHDLLATLAERDCTLIAPPTLAYEVASVLRVQVHRHILGADAAAAVWSAFRRYPLQVEAAPDLPDRAWVLASRLRLPTAYDAAFLCAAGSRPFVTADRALQEACRGDPEVSVLDLAAARTALFGNG